MIVISTRKIRKTNCPLSQVLQRENALPSRRQVNSYVIPGKNSVSTSEEVAAAKKRYGRVAQVEQDSSHRDSVVAESVTSRQHLEIWLAGATGEH